MTPAFRIAQGNTPKIADTLTDSAGNPEDLTGCALKFIFQCGATSCSRTAAITNSPATAGAVNYQTVAADVHFAEARRLLATGGRLIVELGAGQEAAVRALFTNAGLTVGSARNDLARIPRVLGAKRAP